jgi:DNA gyrase/topoisomerase IV subunit A
MDIEAFFKNQDVKKWAKWGGSAVVAIWIVREIFMMTMFHSMFSFVTGGINSQEMAMKSMQEHSDQHMQEVEAGMQKVTQGMSDRADEMIQKLEKFKKDFAKSDEVVEALKHARENQEKFSNEVSQYMHEKIQQSAIDAEKESKAFVDRIAREENQINKMKSREPKQGWVKKDGE